MKKWVKVILTGSLILNFVTLTSLMYWRSHSDTAMLQIMHMASEKRRNIEKDILHTLESGDPNKIEKLKEHLRRDIKSDSNADENKEHL